MPERLQGQADHERQTAGLSRRLADILRSRWCQAAGTAAVTTVVTVLTNKLVSLL